MLGLSQLFGKETVVGIDIGSRFIKAVLAEPAGADRWRIVRAAIAPTPEEAVKDGIIVEREITAAALRELLRTANLGGVTGAVAAVAGSSVIVRHVKLPKIAESALRKSIRYEASKHISSSVEDSCVEFEILGPSLTELDKMDVMLVAAPNEMINSRLAVLELAGLEPVAIDIEAFALQRALLDVSPTRPGEGTAVALLDVGAVSTDVTIVSDGYFALTRNIPIAGDHFTTAIKMARRCEWGQAEEIKYSIDMSSLLSPDSDGEALALARTVQPVLDELLREVRRSINYFHSQVAEGGIVLPGSPDAKQVSKLVLSGGSARLKGLEAYMSARLGTQVEMWNIFENPSFNSSSVAPELVESAHPAFALCVGLAVKESAGVPPKKARRTVAIATAPEPEPEPGFDNVPLSAPEPEPEPEVVAQ
jgi:type IV pilus assembly protein PilM